MNTVDVCLPGIGPVSPDTVMSGDAPGEQERAGGGMTVFHQWMLSRAGFRARTLARRALALALPGSDQDSGLKWHDLLANYDPASSCWKTCQLSLWPGEVELRLLATLPKWGTAQHGALYQQPTPELHIIESAGGVSLWPTPTASDRIERAPSDSAYITQTGTIRHKIEGGESSFMRLGQVAKIVFMDPDTQVIEWGEGDQYLNPQWVEEMMGFPRGWTDPILEDGLPE